ncbi:MAG: hypothetical protein F6J87_30850 [Spirulina sp. SIO3F2]|nr:hypothetical protein [Spirulina sp. SIO3F2]
MVKLLLAFAVLGALLYWSFQDWRRAVKTVFFILVIDGALRKWFLPQFSEPIYFLKDFVLLGAYIRYFLYPKADDYFPIRNNFITILIITASGWCFFQAFNPYLGSPLVGVLGIKSYLFYIPLIWMVPRLFRTEEELYIFLRNHLFLLVPVGILGIVQFFSPIHSPINQYIPGRNEPIATFGFAGSVNVRITGTFSYLNSYQGYLSACFGLLMPLVSFPKSLRWQLIVYLEVFLISLNSFMTGSRTPVIVAVLFCIGYFGIRLIRRPELILAWAVRVLPFGIIAASAMLIAFRQVIEAFWLRVSSNEDLGGRIASGFIGPFDLMEHTGFDGFGVGATHAGSISLRSALGVPLPFPLPVEIEPEMGRVALELGPIGFVLWYGMRVAIIVGLLVIFFRLKRPFLRDLALAGALIQTVMFINQMVFHNSFGLYYWLYTSFLYALPWLERVENWRSHNEWLQQQEEFHEHWSDAPDG